MEPVNKGFSGPESLFLIWDVLSGFGSLFPFYFYLVEIISKFGSDWSGSPRRSLIDWTVLF